MFYIVVWPYGEQVPKGRVICGEAHEDWRKAKELLTTIRDKFDNGNKNRIFITTIINVDKDDHV